MRKGVAAALAIGLVALALLYSPSVLLRLPLDPTDLRPHDLVVLNPLRARAPERHADAYLRELAAGRVAHVEALFGANREVMRESERRYPPVGWSLENLKTATARSLSRIA